MVGREPYPRDPSTGATFDELLDSLPAHAALLDSRGVILLVNGAWRAFAAANALMGEGFGVGQNYLEVCDRARGACADEAAAVAAGLRAVLTGATAQFSLEYPCHSPSERRWFRVMVSALRSGAAGGALVMHFDVTERRSAEAALRESEQRYRLLFESNPQPMWVYDTESLRFLAVNEAATVKYGYSREEFLAMTIADIRPADDVAAVRQTLSDDSTSMRIESIWRHRLKDGSLIRVEISSHTVPFAGRRARMVLASDVTRREASFESLRTSERELRALAAELDRERARLVAAQAVAKVGSWETDLGTFEVRWSDEVFHIFGVDRGVFRPTHEAFLERVHPADRLAVDLAFRSSLGSRDVRTIEHRILRPDGSERAVEERWQTLDGPDGSPRLAIGTCQDVTERRAAESELRRSQALLRTASRVSRLGAWGADVPGLQLALSEEVRILFELSSTDTPTIEQFQSFYGPGHREAIGRALAACIEQGTPFDLELQVVTARGRRLWTRTIGEAVRDVDGRIVRVQGAIQDVDDERTIRERLAEQAALLDAAHEAILVKDLDDRILYWNKGAESTYGWTAEEAVGRASAELLYVDPSPVAAAVAAVLAEGRWQGLLRHRTKSGAERDIEASCTLLRDAQGQPKAILSFNIDITERRQLEAQLLRSQRLESIGTLAGGIAHDLNNVLAPVLMAIEMLRLDESDARKLELLATMEASARRGSEMVRQVLFFARGGESRIELLEPAALVRDIQGIVRETFPKNITVECEIPDGLWRVRGDATQLHQVLMNLCVNARDAMPGGGVLKIALENATVDEVYAGMHPQARPGAYVMIKVADTGSGIPQEIQGRVFEPFFTTKDVGAGTGLGLSTVHSIVQRHEGFINLYSEPERGTKFRVYLPAVVELTEAERQRVESSVLPRGRGELVLVIDDEEAIRDVTRRTLERFGYRVLVAENGAAAVSIFAQQRREIDIVLTDMAMPVMDGPATVHALRAIDPAVRVVGSSGLAANGMIAKATGAGVERFVPKPYTADALLRALRQVLDRD